MIVIIILHSSDLSKRKHVGLHHNTVIQIDYTSLNVHKPIYIYSVSKNMSVKL